MRNKLLTRQFYTEVLGFTDISQRDYNGYLILQKDQVEIHFFIHNTLVPAENDGQVYIRVSNIELIYAILNKNAMCIHPNGHLTIKPWGHKEFSVLDPDNNVLTFGEAL